MITAVPLRDVILFLDDHSNKGYFSEITYFRLYKIIMKHKNTKFFIFNDSCFNGSFIDLVQAYNKFYKLKIENEKINIDIHILFAFKGIFEFLLLNNDAEKSIIKVKDFIKFYQNIKIQNESMFKKIINFKIPKEDNTSSIEKVFGDDSTWLKEIGFKELIQIKVYILMAKSYEDSLNEESDASNYYRNIFNEANLEIFIDLSNNDIPGFVKILDTLYIVKNEIDFDLEPNNNIIITSSEKDHIALPFYNIKINDNIKISIGSSSIGPFIKELFMKNENSPINHYTTIKKDISENEICSFNFISKPVDKIKDLNQQICNENNLSYHFEYSDTIKQKIAALRAISYLSVSQLTETAKELNPKMKQICSQPFNDPLADILAVTALLNMKKTDKIKMIYHCFLKNKKISFHSPLRIESSCLIVDLSFQLSIEPIKMAGVIINVLESVAKKIIMQEILLIIKDKQIINYQKRIFIENEVDKLNKLSNKHSIEDTTNFSIFENEKFRFVSEVVNATITVMSPVAISFAAIIASSLLENLNLDVIEKVLSEYLAYGGGCTSFGLDKSFDNFVLCIKKANINECAQWYLLEHAKASLTYIKSICEVQFKCDCMGIIYNQIQKLSSLSIAYIINDNLNSNESNLFIAHIINPIEKIASNMNIPDFFVPTILALMPNKAVFYALYISLPDIQNNWFVNFIQKLEILKNTLENNSIYDTIIKLAKEALKDYININDKDEYKDSVDKMKLYISEMIQKAITKLYKIQELSILKARKSISKRMKIGIIDDQIKSITKIFKFNDDNNIKLNKILCSTQNEFYNLESNPIKLLANCDKIQKELFIFDKSLIDISNISERASNELNAVAYLLKIYDKPLDKSSLISRFSKNNLIKFPLIAMIARAFNIVEIAPIIDEVISHYSSFEQDEGSDPTLKELMGMHSATAYVLPPKEKNHNRIKMIQFTSNEAKSKEKEIENIEKTDFDSYYSQSDDDEEKCDDNGNDQNGCGDNNNDNDDDLFNTSLLQSKSNATSNFLLNLFFKEKVVDTRKYEELRISEADIIIIRKKLKIGKSTWISDTWNAFIYCFNLRMQDVGIKFDLEEKIDDKRFKASIDEGIQIVLKFYPLPRINDFWKNKDLIEIFLWDHREHSKEIIRAFIQSFDDADRIVTPLYMGKKTYHDRTPEDLKLIYEY